jgi:hypothetical protein
MIVSENPADIKMNKISNTCVFDKVRIDKKDVKCFDFGINKNYCNHYSLPDEFIVTREMSLTEPHYDISPKAMFTGKYKKVANFYYSFSCSYFENVPNLELNIVPREQFDLSLADEISQLFVGFMLLIIILAFITLTCPCLIKDGFVFGFLCGNCTDNNSYYCK